MGIIHQQITLADFKLNKFWTAVKQWLGAAAFDWQVQQCHQVMLLVGFSRVEEYSIQGKSVQCPYCIH